MRCWISNRKEVLEGSLFRYLYVLVGMGMTELQAFGMEVHAVGGLSVEGVAQNRAGHAGRMGGVDAELVGTAALGIVGHAGTGGFLAFYRECLETQNLVTGVGILSVLEIDQLQGAVVVVRTEGQTDVALFVM